MGARRLALKAFVGLCAVVGLAALGSTPAFAGQEYGGVLTFGSKGSGDGQFEEPTGVAVNSSLTEATAGDVYVIDTGNERVERFSSEGAYLSQWNGAATAAKGFAFSNTADAQGVAVDNSGDALDPSAGDVYVADVGNKVIDQFGPTGASTGLELTGTCATPGTCPGKTIPFPGELSGLAVDPSGNLWVVESEKNFDEFSDT